MVCAASAGSKLVILLNFGEEIRPTSRQRLLLTNALFWLFTLVFNLSILPVFDPPTCFPTVFAQSILLLVLETFCL